LLVANIVISLLSDSTVMPRFGQIQHYEALKRAMRAFPNLRKAPSCDGFTLAISPHANRTTSNPRFGKSQVSMTLAAFRHASQINPS